MNLPAEKVASVNRRYAALLKDLVSGERMFEQDCSETELSNRLTQLDGIKIPSEYGNLNPAQFRLLSMMKAIKSFWSPEAPTYRNMLQQLDVSKVHSIRPRPYLLAYFDTIVISHRAYFISDAWLRLGHHFAQQRLDVSGFFTPFAREIREFLPLLPLLEADQSIPLLAVDITPDLNATQRIFLAETPLQYNLAERIRENQTEYLNAIAANQAEPRKLEEWFSLLHSGSQNLDLNQIFDMDKLRSLITYTWKSDAPNRFPEGSEWNEVFIQHSRSLVNAWTARAIFQTLCQFVSDLTEQDYSCVQYHCDPHIDIREPYRLKLQLESSRLTRLAGFSPDMAAAISLSLPPFQWIQDMSLSDIIHFRDNHCYEELRTLFYQQRNRIRYASLNDFETIASDVQKTLTEIVAQEGQQLIARKHNLKKQLVKTSLSFAATITLSITSVLAPPLMIITMPLALWSSVIGGASAVDVVNQLIKTKREDQIIRSRPVAVIHEYLDSSRTQS